MKNSFPLFMILGFYFFVVSGCEQKADTDGEIGKVKMVVDQFAQFWETKNMELLSKIMAHDADMVNYGTGAAEQFVGWTALRDSVQKMLPMFSNNKITIREQVIKVNSTGDIAWFSELWDWNLEMGGQPVQLYGQRLTGVLEKRNGNWVIIQFHNSMPAVG